MPRDEYEPGFCPHRRRTLSRAAEFRSPSSPRKLNGRASTQARAERTGDVPNDDASNDEPLRMADEWEGKRAGRAERASLSRA
jgi:hypothetical protein